MRCRYSKNEQVFKNINIETAYILGLFAADGNIKGTRFSICLNHKDKDLLLSIRQILGSSAPLKFIPSRKNKHGILSNDMWALSVCSKILTESIKDLGFVENKTSHGFNLPNWEDRLVWHFIRGYFDGDGSYCHRSSPKKTSNKMYMSKTYTISFCSKTNICLLQIMQFLEKFGIRSSVYIYKKKDVYYLSITGLKNVKLCYTHLYTNASIFMLRKKEKFKLLTHNDKIIGVYSHGEKFKASIKYRDKHIFLGLFENKNDAILIRDQAAYMIYGHTARLNDENNRCGKPIIHEKLIILQELLQNKQ